MTLEFTPADGLLGALEHLRVALAGPIAHLRLERPEKRNALSAALIEALQSAFNQLPDTVRVAILSGEGEHFSAGVDLSEIGERDIVTGLMRSRASHGVFDQIQFVRVPVIALLHGAVIGCGLELAATCHLRIAERSAYFGLPEGQRGIFVGGSGAVRIPKLIGVARMTDMMLTGRVYGAEEGYAIGLAQYLVEDGQGFAKAVELAVRIAGNAPLSNYAIMHALPRIAEQSHSDGLLSESLMAAVSESTPDAKERLRAFLEKRADKVRKR